jgi:hypothetical protein
MKTASAAIIAAITGLALSGCASHSWAPGPGQNAAAFGPASGQCKLVAMSGGSGGGFVAARGSPQFVGAVVGGSVLLGAIGSAVRQHNIYEACMEANGFIAVDPAAPVAAAPIAAVATTPSVIGVPQPVPAALPSYSTAYSPVPAVPISTDGSDSSTGDIISNPYYRSTRVSR